MQITLGFVETDPSSGGSLHPDTISDAEDIPHKVGGRPLWLRKTQPMDAERVTCAKCSSVMVPLVQLYTPDDAVKEAYLRMVYLYACKNGTCKSFKCFRSQLPESNSFWPHASESETPLLCTVCGLKGTKTCTGCRGVHYCSKQHQTADWPMHKTSCGTGTRSNTQSNNSNSNSNALFNELEIVTEPEPAADADAIAVAAMEKRAEGADMLEPLKEGEEVLDVLDDRNATETVVDVDDAFLGFQTRVEREPEQVIRWVRDAGDDDADEEDGEEDEGDAVLWASDLEKPDFAKDVGCCRYCLKERTFEFQVMPQLLNHLHIDHASDKAFDFGIIVVFTCPDRCQPVENGVEVAYMDEAVFHQNFSVKGLNDRMRQMGMGMRMDLAEEEEENEQE
ncbi:Programmed cell death protein 2 [Chytriomyces hyalinus]|nr:Programmed cell death protein 2 [Chytriomyces hyalinus]